MQKSESLQITQSMFVSVVYRSVQGLSVVHLVTWPGNCISLSSRGYLGKWQDKGPLNHTETMTKMSAIVFTVQLRHKSKQKQTEAQQCIIPHGFP